MYRNYKLFAERRHFGQSALNIQESSHLRTGILRLFDINRNSKRKLTEGTDNNEVRAKTLNRFKHLEVWYAIEQIRNYGHLLAHLDPLHLNRSHKMLWTNPLAEKLRCNDTIVDTTGLLCTSESTKKISSLIQECQRIYSTMGVGLEFNHLESQEEKDWIAEQWEHIDHIYEQKGKERLAKLLLECESFDHFLATKFPTTKRYGCEGAEPMILVFDEILNECHQREGYPSDIIIGMPHRGRLNLLACLLEFDPTAIFAKVNGANEFDLEQAWTATGDVLSHLSTNVQITNSSPGLKTLNVTLLPNPSHLEVASAMAVGTARGRALNKQFRRVISPKLQQHSSGDQHNTKDDISYYYDSILPIQVHGDASISGQGIVQETIQSANLPQFTVGGSLHLVVNNQIGYTTVPSQGRSSRYCTDILKTINAPIIHVNADNIDGVIKATKLALSYRKTFNKDIAIDLICFRRHGHNEMDEPSFTQPVMYEAIRSRPSIPSKYAKSIGLDSEQVNEINATFKKKLSDKYQMINTFKPDNDNYRNLPVPAHSYMTTIQKWRTGCDLSMLKEVGLASVRVPESFQMHPNLERVLKKDRLTKFSEHETSSLNEVPIDWALAEILAFGSLLHNGHNVRIAGQDVARGTFSTRHAVLFDQVNEGGFIPLNNMIPEQKYKLEVANTILAEEGALAYEWAYSAETCELTIWEAQFGDFFNTAQSILDTVVSTGETKWLKQSPLTLLLPHGLDGAGPEHSNSHIERFLTVSNSSQTANRIDTEANTNWSVCFPTLPHQYFHLLRRQIVRPFAKPLIVMSPKILFRHVDCLSKLDLFSEEHHFEPVLDDNQLSVTRDKINTVVLCSGKVWFTLNKIRRDKQLNNIAIVRIEELCPFPIYQLKKLLDQYSDNKKLIWLQEEHKNQGAYNFVENRLRNMIGCNQLGYIGRDESALPAVGSSRLHKEESERIIQAFTSLAR